jgi:Taurine catabolism dioxygenase TauD, TfdA family
MSYTTVDLTPRIGTEVKTDLATLTDGSIARELRALLEQRGVLIFRGLNITDEDQIKFAASLGNIRLEHGLQITKITPDEAKSPIFADYTKGTYFFISMAPIRTCPDWPPSCTRVLWHPSAARPSSATPMPCMMI